MLFENLPLSQSLLKAVAEMGYQNATPVQEQVIPEVLRRNDVIANAQTGTGKTAAFAIPLLQLLQKKSRETGLPQKLEVLVMSPTRELAVQLEENIRGYAKYTGVKSGVVFGGASMQPQINLLKNGLHILVATPGRLLDLRKQGYLRLEEVSVLVLDEADLMLDMGFIDEVQKIIRLSENLEQRLMLSATISPKVEYLARTLLKAPVRIEIPQAARATPDLEQRLYMVPKSQKIELLMYVMQKVVKQGSVLIFRRTKHGVKKVSESLSKNGFKVVTLHGDKSQSERSRALNGFRNDGGNILVATDVAARGLDIDLLDYVINFDLPSLPEVYVHRIGRTARSGNTGVAISFCSAEEREYLRKIEQLPEGMLVVEDDNPYLLAEDAVAQEHKKKGSKYRKSRKGSGSKAKKKRWY